MGSNKGPTASNRRDDGTDCDLGVFIGYRKFCRSTPQSHSPNIVSRSPIRVMKSQSLWKVVVGKAPRDRTSLGRSAHDAAQTDADFSEARAGVVQSHAWGDQARRQGPQTCGAAINELGTFGSDPENPRRNPSGLGDGRVHRAVRTR